MQEQIKDIFSRAMAVASFSNTETERDIEDFLDRELGRLPYFQEHPDLYGLYEIPGDSLKRRVNWALVKNDSPDTVILFHHHDTVGIEDYGSLAEVALDHAALCEKLPAVDGRAEVAADIASGQWQLGRGSCDMKAALALQLGVLAHFSKNPNGKVNLLYLSVGDEESYSQGMRAATSLLVALKERYGLRYLLAVDSEPFESQQVDEKVLHIGTVGKLLPVFVTQGILTHMKEPLKGINAISLLAKVVEKLDLHPSLSDQLYGERSPLPSWSFMRDHKEAYDVSTVLRGAAYLSVLSLSKSPEELMATIRQLTEEAVVAFWAGYQERQADFGEEAEVPAPRVLTYEELLAACQTRPGFGQALVELEETVRASQAAGASYQDMAIQMVEGLLDIYDRKEALVVIAIAPPYYPSMSCRHLVNSPIDIEHLIDLYRDFLEQRGQGLKLEEFFMGICDTSYCALEKPVAQYQQIVDSLAVPSDLYQIHFEDIAQIQVPAINLGPWGKDLHQISERVYEPDMLETIPEFLLYLLERVEEIRV